MGLSDKLKAKGVGSVGKKRTSPLWEGPDGEGPNGGVTQSLLSKFLVCRERFRLLVVEGLRSSEGWNHRTGYGDMWHVCEEALAMLDVGDCSPEAPKLWWQAALDGHTEEQCKRYPLQRELIVHWHNVCKVQFPLYVRHWQRHPDVVNRTPLLSEQVFDVPYRLPSGRTVRLRGKWDSVDLVRGPTSAGVRGGQHDGVWLQENKTKSDINLRQLERQLTFDLQTMLYLVALSFAAHDTAIRTPAWVIGENEWPIRGVRYNVVRRPLHRQGKKETREGFYKRLGKVIEADPDHFFARLNVEVTPEDVARFRRQCLDPVLEQLCDWWNHLCVMEDFGQGPFDGDVKGGERYPGMHYRMPFGVYSPLLDGGPTDLDDYLNTGNEVGLKRDTILFRELSDA